MPTATTSTVEVAGEFSHFVEDPYVEPGFDAHRSRTRWMSRSSAAASAVCSWARACAKSVSPSIRIIEKGGDFGGTWYWNRYPGAQCDIEAYIYLPLLEELGYMPTEKYARAPGDHRVQPRDRPQVRSLRQRLLPDRGHGAPLGRRTRSAGSSPRTAATPSAPASSACRTARSTGRSCPAIQGIETFKGHTFHTSRWDYDYTGGDAYGNLDRLGDKRVGIIGTGATAVQCVPFVGATAKQLYVFQRTPSSVDVRGNRPTDPEWAETLAAAGSAAAWRTSTSS